jgi:hypothetical protein
MNDDLLLAAERLRYYSRCCVPESDYLNDLAAHLETLSAQPAEPKQRTEQNWGPNSVSHTLPGTGGALPKEASPAGSSPATPAPPAAEPKLHPWWCDECKRFVQAREVRVHVLIHLRAEGLAPPAAEPTRIAQHEDGISYIPLEPKDEQVERYISAVCAHGSLRRACPICERDEEIATLTAERDRAVEALREISKLPLRADALNTIRAALAGQP